MKEFIEMDKDHTCPICDSKMMYSERYPRAICCECVETAVTKDGNPITFYNVNHSGGFISYVNGQKGEIHECQVQGVSCYADEARFGGIVVSVKEVT